MSIHLQHLTSWSAFQETKLNFDLEFLCIFRTKTFHGPYSIWPVLFLCQPLSHHTKATILQGSMVGHTCTVQHHNNSLIAHPAKRYTEGWLIIPSRSWVHSTAWEYSLCLIPSIFECQKHDHSIDMQIERNPLLCPSLTSFEIHCILVSNHLKSCHWVWQAPLLTLTFLKLRNSSFPPIRQHPSHQFI